MRCLLGFAPLVGAQPNAIGPKVWLITSQRGGSEVLFMLLRVRQENFRTKPHENHEIWALLEFVVRPKGLRKMVRIRIQITVFLRSNVSGPTRLLCGA